MLKSYDELRKIDVSPYTEKRDGADYLNWAKCIDLLHENGVIVPYYILIWYNLAVFYRDKKSVIVPCYILIWYN